MYKITKVFIEETNETVDCIKRIEGDKTFHIPTASGNRDYQDYLDWLAQGNEPEPADE